VNFHPVRGSFTALLLAALTAAGCSKKHEEPKQPPAHQEKPSVLPRKNYDTAKLFSGLALKTSVTCGQGTVTALETIAETNSYEADITLRVSWPAPATNTPAILAATPELGTLLPSLPGSWKGPSPHPILRDFWNGRSVSSARISRNCRDYPTATRSLTARRS